MSVSQPASDLQHERNTIRRAMRAKRRALTPLQQRRAAIALCRQLKTHSLLLRSKRIAFYLANDGEIDPAPLLQWALAKGKQCYLPVLHPVYTNRLLFVRYEKDTPLRTNRYGILEPRSAGRPIAIAALDLVLLPLVAFDAAGGRLGMGGGYYDRTFLHKQHQPTAKPVLIGLAHACQQYDQLPLHAWDIPLQFIATDRALQAVPPPLRTRPAFTP